MRRLARKPLVYGIFYYQGSVDDGMIVFFVKREAQTYARLWAAMKSAKTWGEFRKKAPRRLYREVISRLDQIDEKHPHATDAFDETFVSLFDDESTPLDAMVDFLPDFAVALGQRPDTPGNGDWVSFQPSQESEVVSLLRSAGWTVMRDDLLVRHASLDWIERNFA